MSCDAELLRKGILLDEARPVDFHFWAFTQRDAAVLGRALYQMGFLVKLLAPAPTSDEPERWSIEAGAKVSPSEALGPELTKKLVQVAVKEDAIFDGWGTST